MTIVLIATHVLAALAGVTVALMAHWQPPASMPRKPRDRFPDHTHASQGTPRLRLAADNGLELIRSPRRQQS
jgi:hypothetical protein